MQSTEHCSRAVSALSARGVPSWGRVLALCHLRMEAEIKVTSVLRWTYSRVHCLYSRELRYREDIIITILIIIFITHRGHHHYPRHHPRHHRHHDYHTTL